MEHLETLEHRSVHILREAYASFKQLCMLWSIGKDSTVLLWLARRGWSLWQRRRAARAAR